MIVAHNTGNGAWTPQTPDGIQADPTFKRSGEDCRCFVIVAISQKTVQCQTTRAAQEAIVWRTQGRGDYRAAVYHQWPIDRIGEGDTGKSYYRHRAYHNCGTHPP